VSTDAADFYPLARPKLARKAVYHFSKELPEEDQIIIEHCLDLFKFGMQSTLQPTETYNSTCISNWSNQQQKFLNADSIHTKACFDFIPSGVYKRLSKLTTIMETNKNLPPDKSANWQHWEDQQKETMLCLFPKHQP